VTSASLSAVPRKAWLLFIAGPTLFLLGIVGASIILSIQQVAEAQIPERVSAMAPQILVGVQVLLAAFMTICFATEVKAAWALPRFRKALSDIAVGLLAGALLAVVYLNWLAPLLETLQSTVGDYVPPGSVLPTISNRIVLFFVANVLFAPFVEETLYRGVALPLLAPRTGRVAAVLLSSAFFGLLHWAGGFWYVLLTGTVAGGAFSGLFYWRGGVLAPFAAHLALNLIEFFYAWHAHTNA
jgi:uncharacterized protein